MYAKEKLIKGVHVLVGPPEGIRGFGPNRAVRYGLDDVFKYVRETGRRDIWKIIQVEHIDAVKDIENILAVPGIDAIIIGPNDLSASLGVLPDWGDPKVTEAIRHVKKKTNAAGIPFGVSYTGEGMDFWVDLGVDLMFTGSDLSFVAEGARTTLEKLFHSKFGTVKGDLAI
jgi:2-dehydro-3-deoxyglucarate aldolase/4-hydroxy-2-oxoheptanedioate aldolase